MTRRTLEIDPQEGADIYLTLDQNIQYFVEKALDAAMTNFTSQGRLGHRGGGAHRRDPRHGLAAGLRPQRIQRDRCRQRA